MTEQQPTKRFSSRVENYVRYRPDYPSAIIPLLQEQTGLTLNWSLADIGSGPGNLTRLLLDSGYSVIGIEPNDAMREAGDVLLDGYPRFSSLNGRAEATTLPDNSIDLITAGQAFHWFDPPATRVEFKRILKAGGWVALIWNKRPEGEFHVLDAYSDMLQRYSPEYDLVRRRDDSAAAGMSVLYGDNGYREFSLPHLQALSYDAFWGRLMSSSYTPLLGQPGHDEIRIRSREIFDEYAVDGILEFPYETQLFLGQP